MKDVLWLNHSDDVSGTVVMDDGTKVYWTEGRSSRMAIISPDGVRTWRRADDITNPDAVYTPSPDVEIRSMTPTEEAEWEEARSAGWAFEE